MIVEIVLALVCGAVAGAGVTAAVMRGNARRREELNRRLVDETLKRVTAEMRTATDAMLRDRQREFRADSSESIGALVRPLKEDMERMRRVMAENTAGQASMSAVIRENLMRIIEQGDAMRGSADKLSDALRNRSKSQGNWGERVLGELLESLGLKEGYHYDAQKAMTDETGRTVRTEGGGILIPDIVLHLDEERELIIDSKVSLKDFLDYADTTADNDTRARALAAHVASLRRHVDELSRKDYSQYVAEGKIRVDYVIMFVPNSSALWAALNADTTLWRTAMQKNVFIADEQTLYAALRIIDLTWRHIEQARNRRRVFELADQMVERVSKFAAEFDELGARIEKLQDAHRRAGVKLRASGPSIITTARKLTELGAKHVRLPGNVDDETSPA